MEPHCKECREEREYTREESKVCNSCETLKSQLASANHREQQLLSRILELTAKPAPESAPKIIAPELLRPKMTNWRVKQQMLEEEDRNLARALADKRREAAEATLRQDNIRKQQSVDELEKELEIPKEA